MSKLGGFKNMLRTWRINLRKKKKRNKFKSIVYSAIAVLIYPFNALFEKNNSKNKVQVNIKKEKQKNIEKSIDKSIDIRENKTKKIDIKEKNINKDNEYKEPILEKLKKVIKKETKEDNILKPIKSIETKDKNTNKTIDKPEIKKENIPKKNNIINGLGIIKNNISNKNKHTEENLDLKHNDEVINENNKLDTDDIVKEEVKKTIFDLKLNKELNDKINKLDEKIDDIYKYSDSYYVMHEITDIKEKIEFLKNEKENNNIIFENNLSFEDIEKLEKNINLKEEKLESKKKDILNPKVEIKEDKKEEKKKEIKEKKEVSEFEIYSKKVIENIELCNKYYNEYLKEFSKTKSKNTIFKYGNIFSNSILSFMLGIVPLGLFKNSLLKKYIIALNVNNTIRAMGKIFNPLGDNMYSLLNEYRNVDELLNNTYNLMLDSLDRISSIKEELINLGVMNYDLDLYNKINNIEKLINENIKDLELKHKNLNKMYVKIKNDI